MSHTAKFVTTIKMKDPDTKGSVELSVYKHEGGGMFAIDSSYIDQDLDEMEAAIMDPFSDSGNPETLYLEE